MDKGVALKIAIAIVLITIFAVLVWMVVWCYTKKREDYTNNDAIYVLTKDDGTKFTSDDVDNINRCSSW